LIGASHAKPTIQILRGRLLSKKKCLHDLILYSFLWIYQRIMHVKATYIIEDFFENIYRVGAGTIIATILVFSFNVMAGRIAGPTEYGIFTLIQTVGLFLYIPMILGSNIAMVKYANENNTNKEIQSEIIASTYVITFISILIFCFLYIIFADSISIAFSIGRNLFDLSIIFAILLAFYNLTLNTLRSLYKMKYYAAIQTLYGIALLIFFYIFVLFGRISFKYILISLYISYALMIIIILIYAFRYIKIKVTIYWIKTILRYSIFTFLGSASFAVYTNIDKLFINKYFLPSDIGLYNAYYLSSINVIMTISVAFTAVFFPSISRCTNRLAVLNIVNNFIPYVLLLGLPFILITQYLILRLYGDSYQIIISLMVLFAIASILFICYDVYAWMLNSDGEKGPKITLISAIIIGLVNIILNMYLVPLWGLHGAIGSTAIAYCLGLVVIYNLTTKYLG